MSIYQKSVIQQNLLSLDKNLIEKSYQIFKDKFNPRKIEEIKNLKEEEYQDGFLRDLFVSVLGYTLRPDEGYDLVREQKNKTDGKKSDGAIINNNNVIVVIELKSTKTKDLNSITNQAFNYKHNQAGCKYIITSNFNKLRLYVEYSHEYEEFNLFNLQKDEFELLYLLLRKESVFSDIPIKLKEETIFHEQEISNQLYKDYSSFKDKLFKNLVLQNSEKDKLILFKKSQKLLDRFLFILFSEDCGLLPPNSIPRLIEHYHKLIDLDAYKTLYDIFKQYFGYMNIGRKGKTPSNDIPAYNGGLFYPDELLDSLIIDDDVLFDLNILSEYDFNTEVDVNILGHIFEHSLNDIENITSEILGTSFDKNKGKRKKDGVFYTPKYITQYIVENTIGKLCIDKRKELEIFDIEFDSSFRKVDDNLTIKGKSLFNKLTEYKEWLFSLKILDPACGSGAFLNQSLNFLIDEHKTIDDIIADLTNSPIRLFDTEKIILEKNLFGVDINEESVDIAKLSLWIRTAQKGRKLSVLSDNIKCGNSLISDSEISDKSFNWDKEFPDIMGGGGFDVVIGNPPYIFSRDNISQEQKSYYIDNYVSAEYQINTYLLFIEKTINLISENSNFGLIIPNSWLMVSSAKGLRKFILQNCSINQIVNLEGYSFEGVNVETIIILATKKRNTQNKNNIKIFLSEGKEFKFSHKKNQSEFQLNDGVEFKVFSDDESVELTNKIKSSSEILDDLVQIKAGLQAYEKGKGEPKQTKDDVINRPYDFNYKYDENTYRYLEGKNVGRYFIDWSGLYLQYGKQLAAPRTFNLFEGEKIIIREITGKYPRSIISTYSNELYLYNRSNISIIERENKTISLKYIVSILNSNLMSFYFIKNTAKSVRKMFPKIILNDLRKFPFKEISVKEQQPFIEKSDKMLELTLQVNDKVKVFLQRIQDNLEVYKISKKMNSFYERDFKSFYQEIKKQKTTLTLYQQDEWEGYFNSYKTEINQLQNQINITEKTINQMVYNLYNLTDDEIKVIENQIKP